MNEPAANPADEIERVRDALARVRTEVGRAVVGMDEAVEHLLVALLAGGHVLLEGPPGLGKTLLVRSLAAATSLDFRRIQCTPDLMPSDVTGAVVLDPDPRGAAPRFVFAPGPVFTQVLLCDEINRATPKTQAALLEAMEERRVTIAGKAHPLPSPFVLLATQNPVEMEGTYPLPEAQLDRFLLKVLVARPTVDEIVDIVGRTTAADTAEPRPALDADGLRAASDLTRRITLAPAVLRRIAEVVTDTHPDAPGSTPEVRRFVRYGVSPRGARALALAAKARALLGGRPHVSLDDVRREALPALRHRLILSFEAEAEGVVPDAILAPLVARLG